MDGRQSWLIVFYGLDGVPISQSVDPNKAVKEVTEIVGQGGYKVMVMDEQGIPVYQYGEWDETCLPGFPDLHKHSSEKCSDGMMIQQHKIPNYPVFCSGATGILPQACQKPPNLGWYTNI